MESERAEIEKHKGRIGATFFCVILAIIFFFSDWGDDGEVILSDSQPVEENIPIDQTPDKKISDVQNVSEENIIKVIGANADILFVRDPFKLAEVEEESAEGKVEDDKKVSSHKFQGDSPPLVTIQPPVQQQNFSPELLQPKLPQSTDSFVLTGTAISDNTKTALVKHFKDKKLEGTLMLTVGDNLNGHRIIDITEEFLILDNGEKIFLSLQ